MTDFDYEVKEKKNLARSAKYKVNGSKSRKCNLATDYMTPAQIKKMNGETVSYNLNRPMTLKEFKRVPPEAGKEYIMRLVDLYGVNFTSLAKMFGCCRKVCYNLLSAEPYNISFSCGSSMSQKKREMWGDFLKSDMPDGEAQTKEEPAQPEEPAELSSHASEKVDVERDVASENETKPAAMKMDRFSLHFSGHLSVDAIANSLRLILGDGMDGSITVEGYFGDDSFRF